MAKDGGPAFPREDYQANGASSAGGHFLGQEGMSLRDYFAAQALASVDRKQWRSFCLDAQASNRTPFQECAAWCGEMADAMVAESMAFAEREKGSK